MDRLTERIEGKVWLKACTQCHAWAEECAECDDSYDAWEKLNSYENAAPLPQVEQWARADKEGRLVLLPCAVGSDLYRIVRDGTSHITLDRMLSIRWSFYMPEPMIILVGGERTAMLSDIGETLFLTREAAQAALEKMKEEQNDFR